MNIDEFWSMVGRVHVAAPRDMDEKCRRLAIELNQLSCEEILSFDEHFTDLFFQAYDWEIWAAAYIIGRGCSDDGFMDFRSTLISLGREAYETALRDADSLVEFDIERKWARYEGYQYVAGEVYEEKCGKDLSEAGDEIVRGKQHPKEPTGRGWHAWDLHERYPRLAAKYGWEKRDWSAEKQRHEKRLSDEEKSQRLAQLMVDACIILACGFIPPPRVALEVVRSGRSPSALAKVTEWQPLDIDEGHYWAAARCLGQGSVSLNGRPDLAGRKMTVDTGSGGAMTFAEWEESLRVRGLLDG